MDKSLRQQHRQPPVVPLFDDPKIYNYLRALTDYLVDSFLLESKNTEQFYYNTLEDSGTPSVVSQFKQSFWVTGGTTTITNFLNGYYGQVIVIVAEHSLSIAHNSTIHLLNSTNFAMVSNKSLCLILKDDDVWYELWRGGV